MSHQCRFLFVVFFYSLRWKFAIIEIELFSIHICNAFDCNHITNSTCCIGLSWMARHAYAVDLADSQHSLCTVWFFRPPKIKWIQSIFGICFYTSTIRIMGMFAFGSFLIIMLWRALRSNFMIKYFFGAFPLLHLIISIRIASRISLHSKRDSSMEKKFLNHIASNCLLASNDDCHTQANRHTHSDALTHIRTACK